MAVGETAGEERVGSSRPAVRRVASLPPQPGPGSRRGDRCRGAGSGRQSVRGRPAVEPEEEIKPLIKEADPDFERLLAEEEEIERSTREHHETPHFRPGDGD